MKRIALFLCLLLTSAAQVRADDDSAKIVGQVKAFYGWYIHVLNMSEGAETLDSRHRPTLRKYVAAALLRRIDKERKGPDGLDGDPFTDAQDWDRDWEKNTDVKDVRISGGKATARVILSGKELNRKLALKLTLEDGAWKISDVKALD